MVQTASVPKDVPDLVVKMEKAVVMCARNVVSLNTVRRLVIKDFVLM